MRVRRHAQGETEAALLGRWARVGDCAGPAQVGGVLQQGTNDPQADSGDEEEAGFG